MSRKKPKTGGRRAGTPNRKSLILHEVLDAGGLNVPLKLMELMPKLSPEKQADVLLAMLPYLYPKRKAVDFSIQPPSPITKIDETRSQIARIPRDPEATQLAEQLMARMDQGHT